MGPMRPPPPGTIDTEPGLREPHEVRDANQSRHKPHHVDECFFCGRGLTEAALANGWWVHLANYGIGLAPVAWEPDEELDGDGMDMGWFPVGSECAKKVSKEYRARGMTRG